MELARGRRKKTHAVTKSFLDLLSTKIRLVLKKEMCSSYTTFIVNSEICLYLKLILIFIVFHHLYLHSIYMFCSFLYVIVFRTFNIYISYLLKSAILFVSLTVTLNIAP